MPKSRSYLLAGFVVGALFGATLIAVDHDGLSILLLGVPTWIGDSVHSGMTLVLFIAPCYYAALGLLLAAVWRAGKSVARRLAIISAILTANSFASWDILHLDVDGASRAIQEGWRPEGR